MDGKRHLEEADRKYLWHPFTQMQQWEKEQPVIIEEGKDCFLRDLDGKWYIDGVSSLWVNIHGHRRQEIDDAIKQQIDRVSHSTLLGLGNVPAIELAEKLIQLVRQSAMYPEASGDPGEKAGASLSRVFYSDNGSTAVEVALKMAFQYWRHKGVEGRNTFVCLNNAYHGDTLGAVSVGGIEIFHQAFAPLLFRTHRAPSPFCYRCELGRTYPECGLACAAKVEDILKAHGNEIAALIIEPLVQAAGGMIVSPPGYLKKVREACSRHHVLMIADEVATGFGRTGRMFACEHESLQPDILCLSKGITGGYLPLAATIATDEIYSSFLGEFRDMKTFFHGHSYTGNPLAAAAALACLQIFKQEDTIRNLQPKIRKLEAWLRETSLLPHVGDVRSRGLMAGVELVRDKETKEAYAWEEKMGWRVAYQARENGLIIRPLGNVIVIMPPLSISMEQLEQMLTTLGEAIREVT